MQQFLDRSVNLSAGEVVDLQALNNLPFAVNANCREGGDDALGHTVGAVAHDGGGGPGVALNALDPVAHVVDGGGGSGGGGGSTTGFDDGSATLGHGGDEVALNPGAVSQKLGDRLALNGGVSQVRVLGGGVVTPDGDLV